MNIWVILLFIASLAYLSFNIYGFVKWLKQRKDKKKKTTNKKEDK